MFNLLKSDIYRLVHGKMLWVSLICLIATLASGTGTVWFVTTPEFASMTNEQTAKNLAEEEPSGQGDGAFTAEITSADGTGLIETGIQELNERKMDSHTYSYAQMFTSGGFLGLLSSIVVALMLVSDFKTGFIKNVLSGRRGRGVYMGEKLILTSLVCAVFLLVGMAVIDLGLAAVGYTYENPESIGQIALWATLTWLVVVAYAFIVACIVWATRSTGAGIAAAILLSGGIVESMVMMGFSTLGQAMPIFNDMSAWMLVYVNRLLGGGIAELLTSAETIAIPGISPVGHVVLVTVTVIAICATLSLTLLKRKDV